MTVAAIRQRVLDHIDSRRELLLDVSHRIHANPELNFEEHFAHGLLTEVLEREGVDVERHAYDLPTAFDARVGSEGPTIAVLCEYDALPGIGHACGHNIIAAAGLGAGLALAPLADELGGRLAILGTPAEEGGGGKVFMIQRGAFDAIDASMMVHPAGAELRFMHTLAIHQLLVDYHGRAAHAAAGPWHGINALDAAVAGYTNVAALRPDERVHGIFTKSGDRPNIVPEHAQAHWFVRSPDVDKLQVLKDRVLSCLEAGAMAAGCEMSHQWLDPPYENMVDNEPLLDRYCEHARSLGRDPISPPAELAVAGSTDMGNVSQRVPAIHPIVQAAPRGVAIHTAAFAEHARAPIGDQAVIDGAKMLALTMLDIWLDEDLRRQVRAAHRPA